MKKIIVLIIFSAIILIIGFQAVLADNVDLNCSTNKYPWCGVKNVGGSGGLVARFYNIGLALVGLTAFGAMVFGAIKYTLSEGNPSKMQDALAWIWGAIWGIILLLGAWLLLNTINPELVELKDYNVKQTKKLKKADLTPQWVITTTTASGEKVQILNQDYICSGSISRSSCNSQSKCQWIPSQAAILDENVYHDPKRTETMGACKTR